MRTHPLRTMLIVMGVSVALLLVTILLGRSPNLGLDLQGGVSVNLQPVRDGEVTDDVTAEQLDQAIGIIRNRVDAVGVTEPEVSRQGNTITVQIPGATDQEDVLALVGRTAELRFRPVLEFLGPRPTADQRAELEEEAARLTEELGLPEGVTAIMVAEDEQAQMAGEIDIEGELGELEGELGGDAEVLLPPGDDAEITDSPPPTTAAPGTTIDPTAGNGGNRSASLRLQDEEPPAPETEGEPAPDEAPDELQNEPRNQWGVDIFDERFSELYQIELQLGSDVTDPADDLAEETVVLVDTEGNAYRLGPTLLTGTSVEDATSGLNEQGLWVVNPVFRAGPEGIDAFNAIAAQCYAGDATCPAQQGGRGSLAIALDSEVLTAPSINEPNFARDQIQISGAFDQDSARDVAVALRFGSLPIELEPQQAETVSATLGQGALRAGIIAGLVGLLLVFAYLFVYYRRLALTSVASLLTTATLLWVLISWIGATVTLAGVVGLVVAIGIAVDSSIVTFEGLKEDVRNGATVRSVATRSLDRSYATVVKANIASLIGAAVLYQLSIGPVRGFAFYLGSATLLGLFSTYFITRPGVLALSRSAAGRQPPRLGIPIDDLPAPVQAKLSLSDAKGA